MPSRNLLELPAEIRNEIYRHWLRYDGIKPEVRSPWNPWLPVNLWPEALKYLVPMCQDRFGHPAIERSGLRLQLDVMAPIRNGAFHVDQPVVLARDILSPLRTCRQIYEEAHHIFWAENAFIFPDQDTMHFFTRRVGAQSFDFVNKIGIEKSANPYWTDSEVVDRESLFADFRTPPIPQPLCLHGWEAKFEEFHGKSEHWVPYRTDLSEIKLSKCMLPCKTTYKWLTRPPTREVRTVRDASGVTDESRWS